MDIINFENLCDTDTISSFIEYLGREYTEKYISEIGNVERVNDQYMMFCT